MAGIWRGLIRPGREAGGGAGFWLFVGHLVTTFGIALSNFLLFFTLIWTGVRWRRPGAAPRRSDDQGRQRDAGSDRDLRLPRLPRLHFATSNEERRRRRRLLLPLAAYSGCFVLSAVFSYGPATSLGELSTLFSVLTLPLALLLVRGERQVRVATAFLVGISVVLAIYGLAQFAFTDYGPLHQRIPGPFSHYMTFSGVLLLGLALIAGRLTRADGWRSRTDRVALALVGGALVLTLTRSAWLGAAALAATAIALQRRRVFVGVVIAVVLGAVSLAAVAPTLWPTYWQRATSMIDVRNPSNYDRLCMLWAGGQMIADRPLVGIGPAMVREWYPAYRHPTSVRPRVKHLHNTFVHMAASRGIPSLLCYLWLIGAAASLAFQGYRREGGRAGPRADLYLGVLFALLALNVAGLFEANWRDTEIQRWTLFLLALPVCLGARGPCPDGGPQARNRTRRPASGQAPPHNRRTEEPAR